MGEQPLVENGRALHHAFHAKVPNYPSSGVSSKSRSQLRIGQYNHALCQRLQITGRGEEARRSMLHLPCDISNRRGHNRPACCHSLEDGKRRAFAPRGEYKNIE